MLLVSHSTTDRFWQWSINKYWLLRNQSNQFLLQNKLLVRETTELILDKTQKYQTEFVGFKGSKQLPAERQSVPGTWTVIGWCFQHGVCWLVGAGSLSPQVCHEVSSAGLGTHPENNSISFD